MFGISILLFGGITFLAVSVAALVLVFTNGESKGSCGCCAGCGLVGATILALLAGVGIGFLLFGRGHHRSRLSVHHVDTERVFTDLDRGMDELEWKLDRMFDD